MRRSLAAIPVTLLASAALALGAAAPASAHAAPAAARRHAIVIREIFYNSPGSDRGSNASLNAEWVKLHNRSGHRVHLTGWTLRDAAHHVYTFGHFILRAHKSVKVHTGSGRDTRWNVFQDRGWYVWNNTGDRATLRNASGLFRDRCTYSDPSESFSAVTC
jgi:hypothetical protein